jgi:small subunit ribosomal protein S8
MTTDRVGDFIIRLQNASAIGAKSVSAPYSTHLEAIARKLKSLGFVSDVSVEAKDEKGIKKLLKVALSYDARGGAKLRGVKRISKPGRRLYIHAVDAHTVAGGTGSRILSTPSGILTDREARKNKVGGENLFEIW